MAHQKVDESERGAALVLHHVQGFGFPVKRLWPDVVLSVASLSHSELENACVATAEAWQHELKLHHLALCRDGDGGVTLDVGASDYSSIVRLIQKALDGGWSVELSTAFRSRYKPGDTFDPGQMEAQFVTAMQASANCWDMLASTHRPSRFLHLGNWHTPEGKRFCLLAREHRPDLIPQWDGHDLELWTQQFNLWQHATWWPVAAVHPTTKRKAPDTIEPDLCVVCEERAPNTLVLPCGHAVLCVECSDAVSNTHDAQHCLRCRQTIEVILSDHRDPVFPQ